MTLFGSDSFAIGGLVQSGRQALLKKDFEKDLECFAEAAQKEPTYVVRSMHFSEGIWTYVGWSQYTTGRLREARQSLERALATDKEVRLARLYWGLALLRGDDRMRGLAKLRTGLQNLTIDSTTSPTAGPSSLTGILIGGFDRKS